MVSAEEAELGSSYLTPLAITGETVHNRDAQLI